MVLVFSIAYGAFPVFTLCFAILATLIVGGPYLALLLYHIAFIIYFVVTKGPGPAVALFVDAFRVVFSFEVRAPVQPQQV